jgi:hypothetical protein
VKEQTVLGVEAIMELQLGLGIHIFTHRSYANKKERIAMKSTQSPVVSNIYTAHFKEMALDVVKNKRSLWLHYVDDTLMV